MKDLIDAIKTFLEAAILSGDISAKIIMKGYPPDLPDETPIEKYPVVYIDDGGESVEADIASDTQNRIYRVMFFVAVMRGNSEDSLDELLTVTEELKVLIEKQDNRQLDGHKWGISINTVAASNNDDGNYTFFRGREIEVQYEELEDTYGEF